MVHFLIPRCTCDCSAQNLVMMGTGILKGMWLQWQRRVFLLASLKQLPTPALCFTLCWILLQQSSKVDQMSIVCFSARQMMLPELSQSTWAQQSTFLLLTGCSVQPFFSCPNRVFFTLHFLHLAQLKLSCLPTLKNTKCIKKKRSPRSPSSPPPNSYSPFSESISVDSPNTDKCNSLSAQLPYPQVN